jgi:hypothetical protein
MRLLVLLLGISFAGLPPGCSPANRDQLARDVLRADPSFVHVLQKHRELSSRIETYQRELALKRATIERTTAQLRKDLATATEAARRKAAETRKLMRPDRDRLKLALSMAAQELRAKQAQRASLGRSMAKLRKAVKNTEGTWTAAEHATHEQQLQEMLQDATRLDQEITGMRSHIRLLQMELLLIKL